MCKFLMSFAAVATLCTATAAIADPSVVGQCKSTQTDDYAIQISKLSDDMPVFNILLKTKGSKLDGRFASIGAPATPNLVFLLFYEDDMEGEPIGSLTIDMSQPNPKASVLKLNGAATTLFNCNVKDELE